MARIKMFGNEAELTRKVQVLRDKGINFTAIEVHELPSASVPLMVNLFDVHIPQKEEN